MQPNKSDEVLKFSKHYSNSKNMTPVTSRGQQLPDTVMASEPIIARGHLNPLLCSMKLEVQHNTSMSRDEPKVAMDKISMLAQLLNYCEKMTYFSLKYGQLKMA